MEHVFVSFFSKEPCTMRLKWEVLLYVGLGTCLGLGIAAYRPGLGGPSAQAALEQAQAGGGQPGKKEPGGVFSPPGTSDSGTVVPPPGEPPFKGKIGRTVDESTSYWPPLARAPKDAP